MIERAVSQQPMLRVEGDEKLIDKCALGGRYAFVHQLDIRHKLLEPTRSGRGSGVHGRAGFGSSGMHGGPPRAKGTARRVSGAIPLAHSLKLMP